MSELKIHGRTPLLGYGRAVLEAVRAAMRMLLELRKVSDAEGGKRVRTQKERAGGEDVGGGQGQVRDATWWRFHDVTFFVKMSCCALKICVL